MMEVPTLTSVDLAAAGRIQGLIETDAARVPLRALVSEARTALASGDKPRIYVWYRALGSRLESPNTRDRLEADAANQLSNKSTSHGISPPNSVPVLSDPWTFPASSSIGAARLSGSHRITKSSGRVRARGTWRISVRPVRLSLNSSFVESLVFRSR